MIIDSNGRGTFFLFYNRCFYRFIDLLISLVVSRLSSDLLDLDPVVTELYIFISFYSRNYKNNIEEYQVSIG